MPKRAAPLECSAEVRAELIAMSRGRSEEARMVERTRIVLACLQGKEIQQLDIRVARVRMGAKILSILG